LQKSSTLSSGNDGEDEHDLLIQEALNLSKKTRANSLKKVAVRDLAGRNTPIKEQPYEEDFDDENS